jgi:uncharacterized membrane protein YbaN (DUF454 family)
MPADHTEFLLKLPPEVAAGDAELHAVVGRILRLAPVRSATVDCRRTSALVRLKPGTRLDAAGVAFGEAAADVLREPLVVPMSEQTEPGELVTWIDPADGSISFIRMPARVQGWRKALYLLLAGLALLLGLLGVVLPGLPTTPFVLLASYCLVRSSTMLHERLMASRVFGGVLRDWYVHRGLRPHVRARAVAVVALVVAVSLVVARPPLPVVLVIGALAAFGLIVIWRLPSIHGASFSSPEE